MRHKLLALSIAAALGIPLFPLGAYFFLAAHNAGFRVETPAFRGIAETQAAERGAEEPGESPGAAEKAPSPVGPEMLARVFRQPNTGPVAAEAPGEEALVQSGPVPGEGKFSYLGLIRESNEQEWLYIKEEETGRIISVNAGLASVDAERYVVEIDGTAYFIRRN
jgi:hypothetical protein